MDTIQYRGADGVWREANGTIAPPIQNERRAVDRCAGGTFTYADHGPDPWPRPGDNITPEELRRMWADILGGRR